MLALGTVLPSEHATPLEAATLEIPWEENVLISDCLTDDSFTALPRAGCITAEYRMVGAKPTRLLENGDVINLGNHSLEVLHEPGRSLGGIALWEAESGSLFTSDMLYDGEHGLAWPPDDRQCYVASLLRMRKRPVSQVQPGHYGPFDAARMKALIEQHVTQPSDVT